MRIQHPLVKSSVYVLTKTLELDLEVGGDYVPARLELFRDTSRKNRWRVRLWERECCRLEEVIGPGSPGLEGSARGKHPRVDEEILVERTWELSEALEDFEAKDARAALRFAVDRLTEHLERVRAR